MVPDGLAFSRVRHALARGARHGSRVLTLPGLAARLAGGFTSIAGTVELRSALRNVPGDALPTLRGIADLPGFASAAANTLAAAAHAALDLEARASAGGRWAEVRALAEHARRQLAAGQAPLDAVVASACERAQAAPTVLGSVDLDGIEHVAPVYRPLLEAVAAHVPVRWSGVQAEPPVWKPPTIAYEAPRREAPNLARVSCADPRHEVVEALRWARHNLAVEGVPPEEIAITAASTTDYDDALHSLAAEANLPLHFVHGVPATDTPEGQTAAALADVVLRGIDQERVQRFVARARGSGVAGLAELPPDWAKVLTAEAPLSTPQRWRRALDEVHEWPGDESYRDVLLDLIDDLAAGSEAAAQTGERWLTGRARQVWRRALDEGVASAVDVALTRVRVDDGVDPAGAVVWAPAGALVASPRPHVRLLGLASRAWPRRHAEDPLLPDHVLGDAVLHERPLADADRAHFHLLLARTPGEVVASRARRDPEGRRLAASPLLTAFEHVDEHDLRPRDPAGHAMSEADRRLSRPSEVARDPRTVAARTAWRDWQTPDLTAHDGLVRANHPAIERALARTHSTTSLRLLLRNPLGFVWQYALGWKVPDSTSEVLTLDPLQRGELLHEVLERALTRLEADGGLPRADSEAVAAATQTAVRDVAEAWSIRKPVPPPVLWRAAQRRIEEEAVAALTHEFPVLEGQRSFVEVPFGLRDDTTVDDAPFPWSCRAEVPVPDTDLSLSGWIDRLDLSGDGRTARVVDYKSGRDRKLDDLGLDDGKELQRCLYAYAVKANLPDVERVDAYLLHVGGPTEHAMADAETSLAVLAAAVREAQASLRNGYAVPGPGAFDDYFDMTIALPADAPTGYRTRKAEVLTVSRARVEAHLSGDAEP